MMAYLKRFYQEAKTKVTTWWLAGLVVLNETVGSFDSITGILPHTVVAHKTQIVSAMAAVGIWTRVRRLIKGAPAPTAPSPPSG